MYSASSTWLRRIVKGFVSVAIGGGTLIVVGPAAAQTPPPKYDLHVLRVFSEGQSKAGFFTTENISADCLWGLMYVDLSSPTGRGQLALLMQAKAQGLKLARVDFTRSATGYPAGSCLATGIHVE